MTRCINFFFVLLASEQVDIPSPSRIERTLKFAWYQRNCNCINVTTLQEKKKIYIYLYIPGIYHRVPCDYWHISRSKFLFALSIWTLNSCTWLPPWRWQGYKPTGWCRSSGFPGESIHMLLTKCLICSESTNFSNDYYRFLAHENIIEEKFYSFLSFFLLRSILHKGYVRHLYFLSRDPFSLSLCLSLSEKVNKYEAKQINMRANLKYV